MANFFSGLFDRANQYNQYPVDESIAPPAYSMDPITAEHIIGQLPDIQKRRRRITRLRADQARYLEDARANTELGHVSEGSWGGGRFRAIGSYIPNLSGLAQQGLGAWREKKLNAQADREEENLDALRNPEIIRSTEQLGQTGPSGPMPELHFEGMPEEQQNRIRTTVAYMTSLHLPQAAIDAYTDSENAKFQQSKLAQGQTAGEGETLPPETIDTTEPAPPASPEAVPPAEPAPAAPVPPAAPEAAPPANPTAQAMGAALQMPQEQSSGTIDVPPEGAPEAAPAGPTGPQIPATDATLRAYLGMIGGPDLKDVVGRQARVQSTKTDADGHVWAVMSDNSVRDTGIIEKSGFKVIVDPVTGQVNQVPTSTVGTAREAPTATGTPMHVSGAGEVTGAQLDARLGRTQQLADQAQAVAHGATTGATTARNEQAVATATAAGLSAEATAQAKVRSDAKAALDEANSVMQRTGHRVDDIIASPVLDKVVGGTNFSKVVNTLNVLSYKGHKLGNAVSDVWLKGLQRQGQAGADLAAMIENITDDSFLSAYKGALAHTGQISTYEGVRAAAAALRGGTYQSKEAYIKALREYYQGYVNTVNALQRKVDTPAGPINQGAGAPIAPAAAPAPAPAAESIDDIIARNQG